MLFWKECKKTITSLPFILYAVAVIVMYLSQYAPEVTSPLLPPSPESVSGSIEKEVPEVLMPKAVESLLCEYIENSYTAYPFLFYKQVKLKESGIAEMAAILEELTNFTRAELDSFTGYEKVHYEGILAAVSYERFKELMAQADKIIGGGSQYSERFLVLNFSQIPMTYEEALKEYEEATDGKNIAESYSRLYCDYIGIILSIMPVFVCAGLWQMDKKSQMEQLIYSRAVSSARLILTRYFALICCMLLPVILTYAHALMRVYLLYPDKDIYFGKALGLAVMWLLPYIMIAAGLGAFLSGTLSPYFAIFLQSVWWFAALESNGLTGSITRHTLIIRHNAIGKAALFRLQFSDFVKNRIGYAVLSLFLTGLLILAYDKMRKGGFCHGHQIIWKNNKRQYQA